MDKFKNERLPVVILKSQHRKSKDDATPKQLNVHHKSVMIELIPNRVDITDVSFTKSLLMYSSHTYGAN